MASTTAAPIITPAATSRGTNRTVPTDCQHRVAEGQAHHCGCGDTTCGEPRCTDDHLSVCTEGAALELFYATH